MRMRLSPTHPAVAGLAAAATLALAASATAAPVRVQGVVVPGWADGQSVLVDARGAPYQLTGSGTEDIAARGRLRVAVVGNTIGVDRRAPGIKRLRVTGSYVGKVARNNRLVVLRGIKNRARVTGKRRFVVRARAAGRLELRINGHRRASAVVRQARTTALRWNSAGVRNGSHLVEVSLWRRGRRIAEDRVWVRVANAGGGQPTTPTPVPATPGPTEPLPGSSVFRATYDNGSTSPWRTRETIAQDRIRTVTSPKPARGSRAVRFQVGPGEDPLGNFGDRAELAFAGPSVSEGQEYWYDWYTLFPGDFPIESNRVWQVFSQWHSTANGSPPLAWYVEGGNMVLVANRYSSPGNRIEAKVLWRGSLKRGQWRHIRMNVKFSGSDSVGFVRLWVDGANVIPRVNVRTTYPGLGNYFKQGYYRCACTGNTVVLYHDDLTITRVN